MVGKKSTFAIPTSPNVIILSGFLITTHLKGRVESQPFASSLFLNTPCPYQKRLNPRFTTHSWVTFSLH